MLAVDGVGAGSSDALNLCPPSWGELALNGLILTVSCFGAGPVVEGSA